MKDLLIIIAVVGVMGAVTIFVKDVVDVEQIIFLGAMVALLLFSIKQKKENAELLKKVEMLEAQLKQ